MLEGLQKLAAAAAVTVLLAGCTGPGDKKEDDGQGSATAGSGTGSSTTDSANTSGVGSGSTFQGHPLDNPDGELYRRTVYFAYDSPSVLESDRQVVEAHARYLAANPGAAITLEGHADERGSREYNIALGDRRAQSVRRVLLFQGASVDQINTVSYGEESPAVEGHDEEAWAKNRRVELKYRVN